jgi:hypothetical protein
MRNRIRAACLCAITVAASTALGHHASNLDYDQETVGTIEGVVDDVFWANPHVHLYLTVTNQDGSTETWDMEGPNLNSMRRRGVDRDMFRIGDALAVTGTLGRDGTKRIWAESIVKADGTVVMGARPRRDRPLFPEVSSRRRRRPGLSLRPRSAQRRIFSARGSSTSTTARPASATERSRSSAPTTASAVSSTAAPCRSR